jgi:UDP-N-acetyl-2-amino-2-deoxyglucuronate dehydrogenase
MRIGILGSGNISQTHARAAAEIPGVTVTAVCGTAAERAARLARPNGAAVYDDLQRFLTHRPMDIVCIGTPSGLHAEHAIAAVRNGLHVLVEKPLDISTARIDDLLAEADRAGVKVGVFFQDRLKPGFLQAKALIDQQRLGTPVLASVRVKWHRDAEYYAASRWRGTWALDGGGALMNQGIHGVDALLWLFGGVERVMAIAGTRLHHIEVEDTAVAVLRFASGALGVIEASTAVFPGYPRRLELTGALGTLILEGDDLVAVDLHGQADATSRRPASPSAAATSPVVSDATAHQRVIVDFIEAIRQHREPACNGREARRSVALVEAIYESARIGTSLNLSEPI